VSGWLRCGQRTGINRSPDPPHAALDHRLGSHRCTDIMVCPHTSLLTECNTAALPPFSGQERRIGPGAGRFWIVLVSQTPGDWPHNPPLIWIKVAQHSFHDGRRDSVGHKTGFSRALRDQVAARPQFAERTLRSVLQASGVLFAFQLRWHSVPSGVTPVPLCVTRSRCASEGVLPSQRTL
jgi:hypothetical protein